MAEGQSHRPRVRTAVQGYKANGEDDGGPQSGSSQPFKNNAGFHGSSKQIQPRKDLTTPEANADYCESLKEDSHGQSTRGPARKVNGCDSHPAPAHRGRYSNTCPMPSVANKVNNKVPAPASSMFKTAAQPHESHGALPKSNFTQEQIDLAK